MEKLPISREQLSTEVARLRAYLTDDSYDSDIAGAYWSRDLELARLRLLEIERTIGYLAAKQE